MMASLHPCRLWLLLFFILCFSWPALCSRSIKTNVSDETALLSFKKFITHDPLEVLGGWNPNTNVCDWRGVECSVKRQRVVSLNVSRMGLEGSLSPFIANLSFLRVLDVSQNALYGEIPPQLGQLFRLQVLFLDSNQFEGSIPSSLSDCRNLESVSMEYNNLSGSIPPELSLLYQLQYLILSLNNLTGTIPPSLGNMSALVELFLAGNRLEGYIPPELGFMQSLETLYLPANQLSGRIPVSLANCTLLQKVSFYSNKLSGQIPHEFGKMAKLELLYLWGNELTGNIPVSISNCSQLTQLHLNENQLSGMVPVELGKLVLLERLHLWGNRLESSSTRNREPIPFLVHLANCSHLQSLQVGANRLTGALPSAIGLFSKNIASMNFENNLLQGSIPPQLANLSSLTFLSLAWNFLDGSIPSQFKNLQILEQLYLQRNRLEGNIPREISQLGRSLGALWLGRNRLSGPIPDSLGDLHQLRRFNLSHNQLSGNIPTALGRCYRLEVLDLSYNKFTGSIPPAVANLPNLIFCFNISNNYLQGPLPLEMEKMILVQAIDVSSNNLSGDIPGTLGSCTSLQRLNLSHNALQGKIPPSLGNLRSLEDIDLSSNNLSGTIPQVLAKLNMLVHLNFSFNNLSGEIPTKGVFKNLTSSSFMGNPLLCGPWTDLSACLSLNKERRHLLSIKIIVAMCSIVVFIICCLSAIFVWKYKRPRLSKMLALKPEYQKISLEELRNATDGFSESNLLGAGGSGSTYRGILTNGCSIAVKVFNLENLEAATKNFARECKALSRARHRNLVKVISSFSNIEFKCLVLEFMSNGSLEKWLYGDARIQRNTEDYVCGLTLEERMNVALDVAHGIEYLHHDCHLQIVHSDLKPSNVLLDDNMTARVSDFGIAKFTMASNSMDEFCSSSLHSGLRGSVGYIAPEYGLNGRASTKGDVYSYGVLLLEMLTRKRPTADLFVEGLNLSKWVDMAFPDRVMQVIDSFLIPGESEEQKHEQCINQLLSLGLLCTKESPQERPTMRHVVAALESIKGSFNGDENSRLRPSLSNLLRDTNRGGQGNQSTSQSSSM